ncbi:DUF6702 family protein [Agaribacter flavus]|uniref:DUF6702 family protein n=1 Tax=Agaribacter flavus TaxID=1902781 RepID=A0ABV7FSA9_9ALTE
MSLFLTFFTNQKVKPTVSIFFTVGESASSHSLTKRSFVLFLTFVLLLAFGASPAIAHQVKAAISRVELNPRTDKLEIMHRFDLHDAEHAVQELFDNTADIHKREETQKMFAEYVVERFGIYHADDTQVALKLVGFEVEGKHFWVYQEADKPDTLGGLQIVHNALRDIWHAQTNTVNVKFDATINTLTFTENTEVLNIDFSH